MSDGAGKRGYAVLLSAAAALLLVWIGVLLHELVDWGDAALRPLAGLGLVLTVGLAVALRRYERRLRARAVADPLTGLPNHRGFFETLERALSAARRRDAQVAIVLLDLDNFKDVNDTHGHALGDEALIAIAARISGCIRAPDVVARIGGDEFGLILPGAGAERAEQVTERVRATVTARPIGHIRLSCSAGVAVYPSDGEDPTTLCRLADSAMYSAKRAGKDRVRRFDPERARLRWSDRQGDEIKQILAQPDAIEAVFQPVASLVNGRLVGYEGLSRFSLLPARPVSSVFAQAHGCGLGPELEAAAIRACLEPLGRPPGTHLAINVSPSALTSPVLQPVLPDDLTDLVIELTEHDLFPDDDALAVRLRELRERGASIAIDDTGAGYAGLRQLMRIKPDIVKLDTDLTRAIHADPPRMALVESFVRFARRIGATVCAEGVESLEDLAALADLDVDYGQGTIIAPPGAAWPEVRQAAVVACRQALERAMRPGPPLRHGEIAAGDRGLEHLSANLAGVSSAADLEETLALIAAELNADKICLSVCHLGSDRVETLAENGEPRHEQFYSLDEFPLTARAIREQAAVEILVGDRAADRREVELLLHLGHRSLLMVPVIHRGESVGLIEAYRDRERPWTRREINRARVISNQFASTIDSFFLIGDPPGEDGSGLSPGR